MEEDIIPFQPKNISSISEIKEENERNMFQGFYRLNQSWSIGRRDETTSHAHNLYPSVYFHFSPPLTK